MACNSSPTATLFGTNTSGGVSTSMSRSVSTVPDSVTTIQSETCVATTTGSDNSTSCAETSTIKQVNTVPGGLTTVQVPVEITAPGAVQTFPTQTLFASCDQTTSTTDNTSPTSTSPTSTSPTSTSTPPTTTKATPTKTSVVVTVITPPPSVKTTQTSTTLGNGSVVQTTVLVTSSVAPSSITSTVGATLTYQQVSGSASAHHNSVKLAPVVGASVGGFFALLGIVGIIWLILRKRGRSWDDIFEKDVDGPIDFHPSRLVRDPAMSLDLASESDPKPYQYGLVGPSITPPFASPPGSPVNHYHQQYMMHDNGQAYSPYHDQNPSYSPDQYQYMADSRRSYSPEYNQHRRQYSADHIQTQHNRRPSATSLLYTPLILPNTGNTAISPEPSVASMYSQATSRPGYSREASSGSGSRPPTANNRLSTDGSSISTHNSSQMPRGTRRLRRPSRPDPRRAPSAEFSGRPPSGYDQGGQGRRPSPRRSGSDPPLSPRMLTLTNWNQSTDAVSFDAGQQPRTSMGSRDQPRGIHNVPSSGSLGSTIPVDMGRGAYRPAAPSVAHPRARSSTAETVIRHTDGGAVRENPPARNVEQMPSEAPPAYS